MISISFQTKRRLYKFLLLFPLAIAIGEIMNCRPFVSIYAHGSISVMIMKRTLRFIYRYLVVVHSQSIALRIAVGEQPSLQHLIGRKTYSWNHIGRIKGSLLHIGKIVVWISIELQYTHINQWIIAMWPNLRQIKGVKRAVFRLLLGHDLDFHIPTWEFSLLNGIIQISLVRLSIYTNGFDCLLVGEVFYSLLGFKVKLHPYPFVVCVNHTKGMAPKPMHVSIGPRNPPIAHSDCHLMQRLR